MFCEFSALLQSESVRATNLRQTCSQAGLPPPQMKLSRKILKFTEPLSYRRGWRRAQRSIFRVSLEPMLLGCGGGFFLFILKNLGHSVLGLDVERVVLFTELLELFGVPRVVCRISAFEPLPDLPQKFDWITAFSVNFNLHHPSKKRWGTQEWDFFLRDLQRHLAPGGKIFFGLNPQYDGDFYTPELRYFFLSRGASIERGRIATAVVSAVLSGYLRERMREIDALRTAQGYRTRKLWSRRRRFGRSFVKTMMTPATMSLFCLLQFLALFVC